jgi:predicted AAA+ superfamily ATPase
MELQREILSWALAPEWLLDRMAFIAGPRQIGKTTAVSHFLTSLGQTQLYYNWDTPSVKKRFAVDPVFFVQDFPAHIKKPWIALDEIHKYPRWKNILKGYYDEYKNRARFIVTGSARLDMFRKSGDSLVGRYFLYNMLPLGWREVVGRLPNPKTSWFVQADLPLIPLVNKEVTQAIKSLYELTGFPQPFVAGTKEFYTRWQENYVSLLLQEDLRDLTKIVELRKLETLLYLLPERVGAPLSVNNLRQTLNCAHATVVSWLEALELVYLAFAVSPWSAKLARSVVKEEKWYFWDWGMLEDGGRRFENFIAVMLARAIAAWNEWGKGPYRLYYLRTKDGMEVDFAVADRKKIHLIVEVKIGDETLSKPLAAFKEKLDVPLAFQVVNKVGLCIQKAPGLYVIGADRFLNLLP